MMWNVGGVVSLEDEEDEEDEVRLKLDLKESESDSQWEKRDQPRYIKN
jgi:hypothetical protein